MNIARINNALIEKSVEGFPHKGRWKSFTLSKLRTSDSRIQNWIDAESVPEIAGVYAFTIPVTEIEGATYKIELDAKNLTKIDFYFDETDFPRIHPNRIVLYVGRTTNLFKRLQLHFHKTKTATQVLHGMEEIFKSDFEHVKRMLLSAGLFHFLTLPGEENCVNRDMVEIGLCYKYRAPINMKSER